MVTNFHGKNNNGDLLKILTKLLLFHCTVFCQYFVSFPSPNIPKPVLFVVHKLSEMNQSIDDEDIIA